MQLQVQQKLEETKADILAIPDNTQIMAKQKVEEAQSAAQAKVQQVKEDFVALPQTTADAIKSKANKVQSDVTSYSERRQREVQETIGKLRKDVKLDK